MNTLTRFHKRITEKSNDPSAAPVLIVALGDSVTQGMTAHGEQTHDDVYHARFKWMLERWYPQSTFSVINAGVSGQTATGALALLERDVIRHQPDLTLISFGLNDAWGGSDKVNEFASALTTLVERIQNETASEVILLTPTFMNKADNPRVHLVHRHLIGGMAELQNSGTLAAYAEAVRSVAQQLAVPCADVYRAWEALAAQGTNTDELLANGLNHPTAEAHEIAAEALIQIVLGETQEPNHDRTM